MSRMGRRGFTFIEAIVLMFVIGIGAVGLMTALTAAGRQLNDGNMTITATALAQEQIDRIVADRTLRGYPIVTQNTYVSPEVLGAPFNGFTRVTTIREVRADDFTRELAGSGVKRAEVEVRWGNANQPGGQIHITTLLTQY